MSKIIGELGRANIDDDWQEVFFDVRVFILLPRQCCSFLMGQREYVDPVVFAGPLTFYGDDVSVIRIKDVAKTSFKIRIVVFITFKNLFFDSHSIDQLLRLIFT